MKKLFAILAAMAAITPSVPAEAFTYNEEWYYTANEELIVKTNSTDLAVKRPSEVWFVPEFYAYTPEKSVRIYPHFGDNGRDIEFKTEEAEDMVVVFNCSTLKTRYTYTGDMLSGGTLKDVKFDMCTRYYGADWKWEAEKNDREKEEKEYGEKEYSLKLKYSSMGYMDIEWNVADFRYDPEKDVVRVPWRARNDGRSDRWTVDGSWAGKTFRKESTFGMFLGTPTGTYNIDCRDNWKGRFVRATVKPYRIEDPHTGEVKLEGIYHPTQNAICKYKDEYREVYKAS